MILKLLIEELTTKPVEFTIVNKDADTFRVDFKVSEAEYDFIAFKRMVKNRNKKTDLNYWNISFFLKNEKSEKSIGISNTGNANIVFSTVINILKKFISMYKPDAVLFSTMNHMSRLSLYKRFIKTIEKYISGYKGIELGNINNLEIAFGIMKKEIPNEKLDVFKVIPKTTHK